MRHARKGSLYSESGQPSFGGIGIGSKVSYSRPSPESEQFSDWRLTVCRGAWPTGQACDYGEDRPKAFCGFCRPNVFDVAFIDGDHHGSAVARDLRLVARKMKPGGKICCHDYEAPKHPGVTDSVNQFCKETEWCVSGRCWSLVVLDRSDRLDAGAG